MFLVYVVLCFIVFGCQYQCNWLPGKTRLRNDLLCVEWDVKPYTLTHYLIPLQFKGFIIPQKGCDWLYNVHVYLMLMCSCCNVTGPQWTTTQTCLSNIFHQYMSTLPVMTSTSLSGRCQRAALMLYWTCVKVRLISFKKPVAYAVLYCGGGSARPEGWLVFWEEKPTPSHQLVLWNAVRSSSRVGGWAPATQVTQRFYCATACNATHGIAVTILSIRLSDVCIVTKVNDGLRIFWYHTKWQSV